MRVFVQIVNTDDQTLTIEPAHAYRARVKRRKAKPKVPPTETIGARIASDVKQRLRIMAAADQRTLGSLINKILTEASKRGVKK